jgi:hypothetical protein
MYLAHNIEPSQLGALTFVSSLSQRVRMVNPLSCRSSRPCSLGFVFDHHYSLMALHKTEFLSLILYGHTAIAQEDCYRASTTSQHFKWECNDLLFVLEPHGSRAHHYRYLSACLKWPDAMLRARVPVQIPSFLLTVARTLNPSPNAPRPRHQNLQRARPEPTASC